MVLNHYWWARTFQNDFAPQLCAVVDALKGRLFLSFETIEAEAEAVTQKVWKGFMSGVGTGDEDPANSAEAAQDAGVSHYLLLAGIRQGLLNLFAVALFHTFEQQVMQFLRRELLHPPEENDPKLLKWAEFEKRLKACGIEIRHVSSWPKVEELRLVTNTVKHAEGDSAQELFRVRPDLFEHPGVQKPAGLTTKAQPRVLLPLVGEDLYVQLSDVEAYLRALLGFWAELTKAMLPA